MQKYNRTANNAPDKHRESGALIIENYDNQEPTSRLVLRCYQTTLGLGQPIF